MENSIPSTSRHGGNRPLPIKDILEYCFPDIQHSCLRHCAAGPKVGFLYMWLKNLVFLRNMEKNNAFSLTTTSHSQF